MPVTRTLNQGDTERLLTTTSRFNTIRVTPSGGDIRWATREQEARLGLPITEDSTTTIGGFQKGESLWIHAEDNGVTVEYVDMPGFLDFTFQNVQTHTQRVPYQTPVEANADQTGTISAGGSQTSTVNANTDTIWELVGFTFEWTASTAWGGAAADDVEITLQTEGQGVEIAHAVGNAIDSGDTVFHKSGSWGVDGAGNIEQGRSDLAGGHTIDDTSGLECVVSNNADAEDLTNQRDIRFGFMEAKI